MTGAVGAAAARAPESLSREERLRRFGEAIDAIRARVEAQVGAEDVAHVKRVHRFSRAMEVAGRALIHVSFEPVGFLLGVVALWLHKQLQATEVGHTALHGAYDKLPGAEGFQSKTFSWDVPIDEEAWRHGHNVRHHQYTNIAGRDPDIHFGHARLTEHTPWRPAQRTRPGIVASLQRAGLIERHGDVCLLKSPALLSVAMRLESAGVDLEIARGGEAILRKHLQRAAEDAAKYFFEHAREGFGRSAAGEDITAAFEALRPMGLEAVRVIFGRYAARNTPVPEGSFLSRMEEHLRSETRSYLRTQRRTRIARLRDALSAEDQTILVLRVDRQLAWNDLALVMRDDRAPPLGAEALKKEAARLRKRFQSIKEKLHELARGEGLIAAGGSCD